MTSIWVLYSFKKISILKFSNGSSQKVTEQSHTLKQFLSFLRQARKKSMEEPEIKGNIHNGVLIYVSRIFNLEIRSLFRKPMPFILKEN